MPGEGAQPRKGRAVIDGYASRTIIVSYSVTSLKLACRKLVQELNILGS